MSILLLPNELLLLITPHLHCKDLNALLQVHSSLYHRLIDHFYQSNVREHGSAALIWAAKVGSIRTLERLLNARVEIRKKSKYWSLTRKRRGGIGSSHPRLTLRGWEDHHITYAARNGHIQFVLKLIEIGVDINFKDGEGRSPLSLASRGGHFDLVQLLTSLGACQLSVDRSYHRPVTNAASQGHNEIADFLLEQLVNHPYLKLNHTIKLDAQRMLLYAAEEGNEKRVRYFLSMGADINGQLKEDKCTPLCGALVKAPHPLKTVELLLKLGADPNIALIWPRRRQERWSRPPSAPIRLAVLREESLPLIKVLLASGADASEASLALFDAIEHEKLAELKLLIKHGAEINIRLQGRLLAEFTLDTSNAPQDIKDFLLQLEFTAEARELARYRSRVCRHPGGSHRRRRNNRAPEDGRTLEVTEQDIQ